MKLTDCLLLADLEDVLKAALPIIFMILYGVAQLVGAKEKKDRKRPAQRPRQAPPQAPGPAPREVGGQPNLEQSLRREVEEFLRRAQGQPAPGPVKRDSPSRPQPAGPGRTPLRPEPQRRRPAETRRLTPASTPISQKATTEPVASAPLGASVAQHVAEHLGGAGAIAQHAQTLGADVALADDRLEQHLKQKFVHQVGALVHESTATQRRTQSVAPMAADLLKLLSTPEGVRQAFLASEIFRRPEDRWE